MRAQTGLLKGLNPTVTVVSKVLVIGFVLFCAIQAEQAGAWIEHAIPASNRGQYRLDLRLKNEREAVPLTVSWNGRAVPSDGIVTIDTAGLQTLRLTVSDVDGNNARLELDSLLLHED